MGRLVSVNVSEEEKHLKRLSLIFLLFFLLLLYVVLCYTSPPERLFLCVSYFYAFVAAFVIASGAPRRRRTSKINAKLLIREFLHQITIKSCCSAVGIEYRGSLRKVDRGGADIDLARRKSVLVRAKLSFQYFRVLKLFFSRKSQAKKKFHPLSPCFTFFHELVCFLFIRARNHSPRKFSLVFSMHVVNACD